MATSTIVQRLKLFRRRASVSVIFPVGKTLGTYGGDIVEITDLRFQFKCKKTVGKEPNTCEVTVTNLSEQSRAAMQGKALRVTLAAGYEGTLSTLFVGDSRHVDSVPEEADWTTKIQLGDGERGYRHGRVNESFRSGVAVTHVLQKIADDMGLDSASVTGVTGLQGLTLAGGYAVQGRAAKELDRLLKGYGFEWSIQDGKLQVLAPEAATAESILELTFESGLIGSPTLNTPQPGSGAPVTGTIDPFTGRVTTSRGKPTLKARSLLQPEIRPGRRIQLDSVTGIKGTFRVSEVEHSGDTAGDEWYSDFEATPV